MEQEKSSMSEYYGEVSKVEVCSSTFASNARKLLDSFAREAEGRGGMQFKIVDAKISPVAASGSRVNVTWQELKRWEEGGEDVRVLTKSLAERMPLSRLQCAGDHRTYSSLPDAVRAGLRSFENLGHAEGGGPRAYGSDATVYEGLHKEKLSSFAFLDNLRFLLGFNMCFEGITVSLMYAATALTLAAMHKENGELESINYNGAGSPKFWVMIPKLWTRKLRLRLLQVGGEELLQRFLKKELVFPTTLLNEWEIPYFTATQLPGWFVLTTGYHQVLNPGYTEARAVNGAIARNTFRYLHSSREIERPMAKKMLVHTEDDESAEKAYQLPLLRLAVDCICDEEKRADGEKLLCEHAVGFLKDRVDDVHAAISKARKEGLPVDDWRGGGAEADELSRRRYPPSERVKAKVWEKKSALQYPCSLCGTDTCLAAVELVSDGGPPAGESGDCQLRMDRMHKSGKHHRASGLRSTGGQAAASEQRASLRLADRAARPVSAESPKAAPRSQAAEIDKGEDARGEPPGSEEHGQEAGPFRNVVCPECFTDNSWEGSKKLKQLIVFPDMAVAEGYVGKPESGQAPCTCREQGLTLEETESEKMESMWRADTPAGNLWYSDCLHNKGVEVTGAGPEEQSWAKSASGKEAHVEEPAGVKTLSLDGAGILKWGGKRLGASSARAACWEGAPDAERRARELGLVPSPLSNFMLFRGKVPGLDSVLWDVRSRVDVRAPEAGRTAAMYLSRNGTKSATGDVGRTAADDSEGSAKSASKDAGNESQAVGSGRLEDVAEDMQVMEPEAQAVTNRTAPPGVTSPGSASWQSSSPTATPAPASGELLPQEPQPKRKSERPSDDQGQTRPNTPPPVKRANRRRCAPVVGSGEVDNDGARAEIRASSSGMADNALLAPTGLCPFQGQRTLERSCFHPAWAHPPLARPHIGGPPPSFPMMSPMPATLWQPGSFAYSTPLRAAQPGTVPALVPLVPLLSMPPPQQLPVHMWGQTARDSRTLVCTPPGCLLGIGVPPQLVACFAAGQRTDVGYVEDVGSRCVQAQSSAPATVSVHLGAVWSRSQEGGLLRANGGITVPGGRQPHRTVLLDIYLGGRESSQAMKARLLDVVGAPPAEDRVYKLLGINAPLLRRGRTLPDGDGVVGAFCFRIASKTAKRLGLKSCFTHQSANFWEAWDHALRVVNETSPDEWDMAREAGLQTTFVWRYLR